MLRTSLGGRITLGIFILLVLMGFSIYQLADRSMVTIVDSSQLAIYSGRIRNLMGLLERSERRLRMTGLREAYEAQFQESMIRDLRAMEANAPSPAKLIIYGREGALLMQEEGGLSAPASVPVRIPAGDGGIREVRLGGEGSDASWGVFQRFPDWGWHVGYLVPLEAKYAVVGNFRKGFLVILLAVVAGGGLLAFLLVSGIVRPIRRLTRAASAMSRGDLHQQITDSGPDEVGVLVTAIDGLQAAIRERIEELAQKNAALSREVEERARAEAALQKAMAELARQNEELKSLDKLKDGLIRDVTHELKTPVSKFRMQIELMKSFLGERGMLEEAASLIEVVDHAIGRQERVIGNILNLARLEAGGRPYQSERISLDRLAAEVRDEYEDLARRLGISLLADLQPAETTGDRQMLRHAITNVLDNAIKFHRLDGNRWIRLRTVTLDGEATIIVEDNGKGMSREDLDRAFERFYQGSASTEGAGVGLSLVQRIILDHGGTVAVDSPGNDKGATLKLTLPARDAGASGAGREG